MRSLPLSLPRSPLPLWRSIRLGATCALVVACGSPVENEAPGAPAFSASPPPGSGGSGPSPAAGAAGGGSVNGGSPEARGGAASVTEGSPGTGATPLTGPGANGASPPPDPGGNAESPEEPAPSDPGDETAAGEPSENPPLAAGPGRAGAELCPAAPFGAPLPANPEVSPLFSVEENNFFIFEGPVWIGDALFFSEIGGGNNPPPSRIHRFVPGGALQRGVVASSGSNGLAVDGSGNLVAATHDVGAISTFQLPAGARGELGAQTFEGQRFNSPNDLVLRGDGNLYFTDPSFQAPGNPQGGTRVYRISPQGEATVVDASLGNPNGITLSPDGNTLYVTGGSRLVRYELGADGTPGAGADVPLQEGLQTPDGMAMDCAGNVYTTEHFRRLIRVIDPSGNELGRFGGPGAFDRDITNLAFGGPNRTTLFVTTVTQGDQGGVFAVELNVPGLPY